MKCLELSQNKVALVDDADLSAVVWYKWCYDGQYAAARINGKKIRLHRFLLGEPDGLVDHINRDKLDNRRRNLRVVNYSQNNRNTDIRIDNTSGHKGVSYDKYGNRWRAFVYSSGKRINLGSFKNITEAVKARELF